MPMVSEKRQLPPWLYSSPAFWSLTDKTNPAHITWQLGEQGGEDRQPGSSSESSLYQGYLTSSRSKTPTPSANLWGHLSASSFHKKVKEMALRDQPTPTWLGRGGEAADRGGPG